MTKEIKNTHFQKLIQEINHGIVEGYLDEMTEKLVVALDFYVENELDMPIGNIFDNSSNVIEAVSKRALFLEQLRRIIGIGKEKKIMDTLGIYYRYYALAQAFYGSPERGLAIIAEAEELLDENTGLFIELRNAKALILSEKKDFKESLEMFEFNYQESKRLDYVPGFRFLHNIGTAYRDLGDYEKAACYIKLGYEYDLKLNYIVNAVTALVELADVYLRAGQQDQALKTLKEANSYEVTTQNQYLYKSYCKLMYTLMKKMGNYKEALDYHELLTSLEIQLNMDKYTGMITEFNMKYDLSEKEKENAFIKSKNYDLEMMGQKLENVNKFLKTTLQKSHEMQEAFRAKNEELESTMASLNQTQEKLVTAEKRSVLDQMFINIAHHMNTPLGVMNTTISHMESMVKKVDVKFRSNELTKKDLLHCIDDNKQSVGLLNESMQKVVGFVDTLRLYKSNDEDEAVEINVRDHFLKIKSQFEQMLGVDDIVLECDDELTMLVSTSLLDKCIELIADKLLASTDRNGFDIEISKEINMISIGLGDFSSSKTREPKEESESLVDTYDFYIIQTIVENLLKGRFIKFEDRGRDYFQFIFQEK